MNRTQSRSDRRVRVRGARDGRDARASEQRERLQAPASRMSSVRGWGLALLLAALVVCGGVAIFAAGSGSLIERLRPTPAPVTTRVLELFRPAAVRPERVLSWLGGTEDSLVVEAALEYEESSTAYALTLFAEDLNDQQRVQLLRRSADQQRETAPGDAASLYVIAGQIALISPTFDDVSRAQLLLEMGDALLKLRRHELALRDWQQASILARYGPTVPAQMRARLLEAVAKRYDDAGETARAVAAREHASEALQRGTAQVVPAGVPQIAPADWPDEVVQFVEQRRTQARVARSELDGGRTPDWTALEEALLAEEGAVQNWLAGTYDEPLRRQERYRRWIQQRRMLSLGVLEAGAIPRIEARRAAFDQILSQLWQQRTPEIEERLAGLPAEEAVAARRAWLEHRLVVYTLGGDPQTDVLTLWHELEQLNGQMPDDARLRLVHQADEQIETRYWRLPVGYFQGTLDAMDVFR